MRHLNPKMLLAGIFFFSMTTMAQHRYEEVIPASKGILPTINPVDSTLHNNRLGCLHLERVYSTCLFVFDGIPNIDIDADMRFPMPQNMGAKSYTLQMFDKASNSWKDYIRRDEVATTTGDNFSINIEDIMSDTILFRLRISGGKYDGYFSNDVTVKKPKIITGYSLIMGGGGLGYVGDTLFIPSINMKNYDSSEREFVPISVDDSICKYSWYRRNPYTYDMTLIEGADKPYYVATLEDVGYQIIQRFEGDDEFFSFFNQEVFSTIQLPINTSFEYIGVDGIIINTDYILPDPASFIKIYNESLESTLRYSVAIDSVVSVKDGVYAIYPTDSLDICRYYDISPTHNQCLFAQISIEPFRMILPAYFTLDSTEFSIRIESFDSIKISELEMFRKNFYGQYEAVNLKNATSHHDTLLVNVLQGDYYLKLVESDNYEATYFPGEAVWEDATIVRLPLNRWEWDSVFVIKPIPALPQTVGSGSISGVISLSEIKQVSQQRSCQVSENTGYNLLLSDKNGDLISKTTSDAEGAYTFSNIPFGEYDILLDVLGQPLLNQPHHVILTSSKSAVSGADYKISDKGIEAVGTLLAVEKIRMDGVNKTPMIYDLNGKVLKTMPQQGLFIINGKVVYIKD